MCPAFVHWGGRSGSVDYGPFTAIAVARAQRREIGRPRGNRGRHFRDTGRVPTVLVSGPYRMYFYSHEPNEPAHVHVDRDESSAKFWLQPVALARNLGFAPPELRRVQRLVVENQAVLLEKWHERFAS
jgi:hypothetical protein